MVTTILECESTVAPRREMAVHRIDRDGSLVESLRRGESAGAELLVTTYQSRAYRLAIGITGNAQDAEEVVQDAFWSVIRRIHLFRSESAFGSWLYRIVANAACQKLRRRRPQQQDIPLDDVLPFFREDGCHAESPVDWSPAIEDAPRDAELRLALSGALDELPANYRAALVLRDVEGSSPAEVAETLGISVANAKTRVHRARLFVRKRLTESFGLVARG